MLGEDTTDVYWQVLYCYRTVEGPGRLHNSLCGKYFHMTPPSVGADPPESGFRRTVSENVDKADNPDGPET